MLKGNITELENLRSNISSERLYGLGFAIGLYYYRQQQYNKAFLEWKQAHEHGHSKVCYNLGHMLRCYYELSQANLQQAKEWLQLAKDRGITRAEQELLAVQHDLFLVENNLKQRLLYNRKYSEIVSLQGFIREQKQHPEFLKKIILESKQQNSKDQCLTERQSQLQEISNLLEQELKKKSQDIEQLKKELQDQKQLSLSETKERIKEFKGKERKLQDKLQRTNQTMSELRSRLENKNIVTTDEGQNINRGISEQIMQIELKQKQLQKKQILLDKEYEKLTDMLFLKQKREEYEQSKQDAQVAEKIAKEERKKAEQAIKEYKQQKKNMLGIFERLQKSICILSNKTSPLLSAVNSANIEEVKRYLKDGYKPSHTDEYGLTSWHYAIKKCNKDLIQALSEADDDATVKNRDGKYPLEEINLDEYLNLASIISRKTKYYNEIEKLFCEIEVRLDKKIVKNVRNRAKIIVQLFVLSMAEQLSVQVQDELFSVIKTFLIPLFKNNDIRKSECLKTTLLDIQKTWQLYNNVKAASVVESRQVRSFSRDKLVSQIFKDYFDSDDNVPESCKSINSLLENAESLAKSADYKRAIKYIDIIADSLKKGFVDNNVRDRITELMNSIQECANISAANISTKDEQFLYASLFKVCDKLELGVLRSKIGTTPAKDYKEQNVEYEYENDISDAEKAYRESNDSEPLKIQEARFLFGVSRNCIKTASVRYQDKPKEFRTMLKRINNIGEKLLATSNFDDAWEFYRILNQSNKDSDMGKLLLAILRDISTYQLSKTAHNYPDENFDWHYYKRCLNECREQLNEDLTGSRDDVLSVTETYTENIRSLLKTILEDCISVLCPGENDKNYEFCLLNTGSMGRNEMMAYSDIEYICLCNNKEDPYIRSLVRLFELKIRSLCENNGVRVDKGPYENPTLCDKPKDLINNLLEAGDFIGYSIINVVYIYGNDKQRLFNEYKDYLAEIFIGIYNNNNRAYCRQFALDYLRDHHCKTCELYSNELSVPCKVDIKKIYEALRYPLLDLAYYYNIPSNSIKIILNGLAELPNSILDKKISQEIKTTINFLQHMRNRLHFYYEKHEEEELIWLGQSKSENRLVLTDELELGKFLEIPNLIRQLFEKLNQLQENDKAKCIQLTNFMGSKSGDYSSKILEYLNNLSKDFYQKNVTETDVEDILLQFAPYLNNVQVIIKLVGKLLGREKLDDKGLREVSELLKAKLSLCCYSPERSFVDRLINERCNLLGTIGSIEQLIIKLKQPRVNKKKLIEKISKSDDFYPEILKRLNDLLKEFPQDEITKVDVKKKLSQIATDLNGDKLKSGFGSRKKLNSDGANEGDTKLKFSKLRPRFSRSVVRNLFYNSNSNPVNDNSSDKKATDVTESLESDKENYQKGWNCFDIAVGVDRQEIVDYALRHANKEEFRKLLEPEIRHAAALTAVYMNGCEETNKERAYELAKLFNLVEILKGNDKEENVKQLSREANELLDKDDLAELEQNILPKSMRTEQLQQLVNAYLEDTNNNVHEQNLQTYCTSLQTYEQYIRDYYGAHGWIAFQRNFLGETSTSMIDIVARMLNKVITIYQENQEIYRIQNESTIGEIKINYNGFNHFEKRGTETKAQRAELNISHSTFFKSGNHKESTNCELPQRLDLTQEEIQTNYALELSKVDEPLQQTSREDLLNEHDLYGSDQEATESGSDDSGDNEERNCKLSL